MNARPYIFGCLCLVGGNGIAAASDASLTDVLLSFGHAVTSSSSFEGGSSHASQGGHDSAPGDVTTPRQLNSSPRVNPAQSPMPVPVDSDSDARDGSQSNHSQAPNWQSMLPGSMF